MLVSKGARKVEKGDIEVTEKSSSQAVLGYKTCAPHVVNVGTFQPWHQIETIARSSAVTHVGGDFLCFCLM